MNAEIASFCWRAAQRRILTAGQCLVLRDLFSDRATVAECVAFIEKNKLVDEKKLSALKLQMSSEPRKVAAVDFEQAENLSEVEQLIQTASGSQTWEPDPGLDWFCYLAVSKGVLTREVALCLIADMDEAADLLGFAQAVVTTGLCNDLPKIQQLTDEALEQWARAKPVPVSIFADAAAQQPAPPRITLPPDDSPS